MASHKLSWVLKSQRLNKALGSNTGVILGVTSGDSFIDDEARIPRITAARESSKTRVVSSLNLPLWPTLALGGEVFSLIFPVCVAVGKIVVFHDLVLSVVIVRGLLGICGEAG